MEAAKSGEVVVPGDFDAVPGQALGETVEIRGENAGMRLARGPELRLDAEVDLLLSRSAGWAAWNTMARDRIAVFAVARERERFDITC